MSVLEIAFVGQCEVFVCLDFVEIFPFFPPWPRSSSVRERGLNSLKKKKKKSIFFNTSPLKESGILSSTAQCTVIGKNRFLL